MTKKALKRNFNSNTMIMMTIITIATYTSVLKTITVQCT